MHVVHVTHRAWPIVGGSERYVQEIARRQVLDGHRVTVITTDASELSALWDRRGRRVGRGAAGEHQGVRIRRLPVRHLPVASFAFPALRRTTWLVSKLSMRTARSLARFSPWVPGLRRALAEEAGDATFAWNITLEGLTAAVALDAARRRVSWFAVPILHLARPRFYTMSHQLDLLRGARLILTLTPTERTFFLGRAFASDRVRVVSPGIDLAEGSGADGERFRRKHGITGPLVVTLATLCYDKGTSHLIAAARRLWDEGRELTLALVGPQLGSVRRALARVPESQRAYLRCPGAVSEEEKWDALDAADVMALPSRTDSFGIVYLEAWSRGKPVIGARAGAVGDVVDDGRDGFLVPFGQAGELASALRTLLDSPDLRAELGERGREKVQRMYQWDQQYARLRAAVDEAMTRWQE